MYTESTNTTYAIDSINNAIKSLDCSPNDSGMSDTPLNPVVVDKPSIDTIDPNDLENLTDEELLNTLQSLEQEKEVLAQQQLLQEIDKLQNELKDHEKREKDKSGKYLERNLKTPFHFKRRTCIVVC